VADPNLYTIRQTALDYLPVALQDYLALPTAYATLQPVRDGKTARQLLLEQLDLMDTGMRQIADDAHRNDAEKLLAHGRFLEEKFAKSELSLDADRAGRPALTQPGSPPDQPPTTGSARRR
jgi:hypothetical protein